MVKNLKTGICLILVVILHLKFAITRRLEGRAAEAVADVKAVKVGEEVAEAVKPAPEVADAVQVEEAAAGETVDAVDAVDAVEAVDSGDAGATCFAETKNMYFPLESRHCCKHLKLKCRGITEEDNFCVLSTEEEFKAFGECCKTRGAGRGIEVDPDPPGAKDCSD